MKYPRTREFEFDHPSGRFTGFVEAEDEKLISVRLTSNANCNLKISEGAYRPGETRFIRENTPATPTGRTRLVSEMQINQR